LPTISVVIPVLNGADTLARLLTSIRAGRLQPLEVLVVDNGSTDGSTNIATSLGATLLFEGARRSSYAARNCGWKAAAGQVIAFTDADCFTDVDWLTHAVSEFEDGADLVAGRIVTTALDDSLAARYDSLSYLDQKWSVASHGFGATANLLIRREVLEKVGGFDGAMISGGDVDLCWRARSMGFSLRYSEPCLVTHASRTRVRDILRRAHRLGIGHATLHKRYADFRPICPLGVSRLIPRRYDVSRFGYGRMLLLNTANHGTMLLSQLVQTARGLRTSD
jgi:glycosyltransferase involved in cell wall biosynthesis